MSTLQTWVIAMSSSHIRSFRHTATVIALEVETALCDVASSVEKEAEVVGRQKEGEKKRKATQKGGSAREKGLEEKAKEIRERRAKLAEFVSEFVDGCVYCRLSLPSHLINIWQRLRSPIPGPRPEHPG
jgi:cohesin complex subunit SA-1/2